jgi:benzylsuccinate CoA-transferase BbsF subunit
MGPGIIHYSAGGELPRRNANRRPGSVPCGVFPCAGDDVWCAIEVEDDDRWQALAAALRHPAWMADPALAKLTGRSSRIDEIETKLAGETRGRRAEDLVAQLQAHGVAGSLVETSADVCADPQLHARGYWRQIDHAEMGRITVNVPPFFSVEEGRNREPGPPPLLGEHTVEIAISLLGLTEQDCVRLGKEQVLW